MIKYFNEDCMTGMSRYPDKYFNLAIVDPPYGIGDFIQGVGKNKSHVNWEVRWNNERPDENYFAELKRVSINQIIWGANYYNCFDGMFGAIVWDKLVTHPDMSKCEIASVSHYKKVEVVRIEWNGFLKNEKDRGIHPCQKPVSLYRWTLANYAKPGDKILDTHVGSASSLIACYDMGFDAVGFELDPDYYRTSKQRLDDFMRQPKLEILIDDYKQIEIK
jgi:site-specific DNA-methyltransferase (adenine-specific)